MRLLRGTLLFGATVVSLAACYGMRGSQGGGEEGKFTPPRKVDVADVAVPKGYRVEVIAQGLTFPTGVTFDDDGRVYVVESGYSYGEVWTTPRLLRVERSREPVVVASGGKNGPWNGVSYAAGSFFVAEGGALEGGRILRISDKGEVTPIVEGLPSQGDHHTNGPVVGRDGAVYFGQGTVTNAGVVGPDNFEFGWLKRNPALHDTPCRDITLAGENFPSRNALGHSPPEVSTGAFSPYGKPTKPGQVVPGRVPCNGAIMKIGKDGGAPELVAWGFRNPFGLAFAPDGKLYVTDNGYDDRGSRAVWGTGDLLWAVTPGAWYGWPDYSGDRPLTDEEFKAPGKPELRRVLQTPPNAPPRPIAQLGVHSSSNGFDFSRSDVFGHVGEAFVAQFGDQAPTTGKVLGPVGFKVVRVDVRSGRVEDFALNKGKDNGPASAIGTAGFERPVAARFDPEGGSLYVVDFGVMLMTDRGPAPQPNTGVLWRISRTGS